MKLDDPHGALTDCEYAMQTGVDNVKALFRQGQVSAPFLPKYYFGLHVEVPGSFETRLIRFAFIEVITICHIFRVEDLQYLRYY